MQDTISVLRVRVKLQFMFSFIFRFERQDYKNIFIKSSFLINIFKLLIFCYASIPQKTARIRHRVQSVPEQEKKQGWSVYVLSPQDDIKDGEEHVFI